LYRLLDYHAKRRRSESPDCLADIAAGALRGGPSSAPATDDACTLRWRANRSKLDNGDGSSIVEMMNPEAALGMVGYNPVITDIAREAGARLRLALELVVCTPPDLEQLEVGVIQVEVARQLLSRRRSDVSAVRLLLVGREEFDIGAGHYAIDSSRPYSTSCSAQTVSRNLTRIRPVRSCLCGMHL